MPRKEGAPTIMPFEQREGLPRETSPEKQPKNLSTNMAQKVNQLFTDRPELLGATLEAIMRELGETFEVGRIETKMVNISNELDRHYRLTIAKNKDTGEERKTGLKAVRNPDEKYKSESFSANVETTATTKDQKNVETLQKKVKELRDQMLGFFVVLKTIRNYYQTQDLAVPAEIAGYTADYESAIDTYNFYLNSLISLNAQMIEARIRNLTEGNLFAESISSVMQYFADLSGQGNDNAKIGTKEIIQTLEQIEKQLQADTKALEEMFVSSGAGDGKQTLAGLFDTEAKTSKKPGEIPDIRTLDESSKKRKQIEQMFADNELTKEKSTEIVQLVNIVNRFYKIYRQIKDINTKLEEAKNSKKPEKSEAATRFAKENSSLLANLKLLQKQIIEKLNNLVPYLIALETGNMIGRTKRTDPVFNKPGKAFEELTSLKNK